MYDFAMLRQYILLLILLVSCAGTPVLPATAEPVPQMLMTQRQLQPINRPQLQAESCDETLDRHQIVADIDYAAHMVQVEQYSTVVNPLDHDMDTLVFNIEANRWGGDTFSGLEVTLNNETADYHLEGKRLTLALPEALEPGCAIPVTLNFRLAVPRVGARFLASKGFFGFTDRQLNLGHWLPTVAVYDGDDWVTRTPSLIGEQDIAHLADWEVSLNVMNAPDSLVVAAPGLGTQISRTSWRFIHHRAREFSVSLSDAFIVTQRDLDTGVTLELYVFADNAASVHALDVAEKSFAMYTDLFGDYLYDRVVVVEGDFPDGMEFAGMVFVSTSWFTSYTGDPASYLTLITAHELAHQWWYARVGNDPAMYPWLDESLATYSEYIYLEEYYPELKDWWWWFRVEQYYPQGFVDSNIYAYSSIREYINASYLRGAQMMHSLRQDIGTDDFFQLLADYAAAGSGKVVVPSLFWSLLTDEQRILTEETRKLYLRQSDG